MNLTRTERWILHNQYAILEKLDPENAHSHQQAQEALGSGYEMVYDWIAEPIVEKTLSEGECRFVIDAMAMYEMMQQTYDNLEDKAGITDGDVVFPGFSANQETKYLGFARYFRGDRHAFQGLRSLFPDLDAHMPTVDLYRAKLAAFEQRKDNVRLTGDELRRVIAAR